MKKLLLLLILIVFNIGYTFAPVNTNADRPEIAYEKYQQRLEQERKHEQMEKFLYKLAMLESSNNWKAYNPYGYMGTWQMGEAALTTIGYSDIKFEEFKVNPSVFPPELQKEAILKLIEFNTKQIDRMFSEYIGKTISGVHISKKGLIAAAHLGGIGSLKVFLYSNGNNNRQDQYNTSIKDYLKHFENYG